MTKLFFYLFEYIVSMTYKNKHIKGWLRVIFVIIAYLFIGNVFKLIGVIMSGIDIHIPIHQASVFQLFIITFFDFIGILIVLLIFMKIVDNELFIDIGLSIKKRFTDILIGILLGIFIMFFGLLFLVSMDVIIYEKIIVDIDNICYMFFLFFLVALKEEILYRGYILRNLMYSFNKYVALLISAILFALMHYINANLTFITFTNIFLGGILLGLSYTFNKNLWFPIALHFSWNFFQSLFGLNAGDDPYSLVKFKKSESEFINIGEFHFEQPLLYTFISSILIICIYIWYSKKRKNEILKDQ